MSEQQVQELAREETLTGRTRIDVSFYLYTPSNTDNPQLIDANSSDSLKKSNFNKKYPTRIIVHGWRNNYKSEVNTMIRKALLDTGKYNVICVDWSLNAYTFNYASAAFKVGKVGQQVAMLIDFLNTKGGMSFKTLNLLGHSLGAHVCGHAGKNVKNGRIKVIIGMDPALPLFSENKPSERLSKEDANYVEAIHTCGGLLGFMKPIGTLDFYPNGGKSQPGCGMDISGACAHSRSYEYYAEAIIKDSFPSMKCDSHKSVIKNVCDKIYSSVRMGSFTNGESVSGCYYVPVNKKPLFGKLDSWI